MNVLDELVGSLNVIFLGGFPLFPTSPNRIYVLQELSVWGSHAYTCIVVANAFPDSLATCFLFRVV